MILQSDMTVMHQGAVEIRLGDTAALEKQFSLHAEAIEGVWSQARRNNPSLFNGRLFCCVSVDATPDRAVVSGCFMDYKQYYASQVLADIPALMPVAVSGMVLMNVRERPMTMLGRRHPSTTTNAGWIELVPSGGLDDSCLISGGIPDHRTMLLHELEEETGIEAGNVLHVKEFLLVLDHAVNTLDICMLLELGQWEQRECFPKGNGEYTSLEILAVEAAARRVRDEPSVPASRAMLDAFTTSTRGSR